jgi:RNA polymerase sigma-70 factor (ECF subfamily)
MRSGAILHGDETARRSNGPGVVLRPWRARDEPCEKRWPSFSLLWEPVSFIIQQARPAMPSEDVTLLLQHMEAGQREAFDRLLVKVYDELRVLAKANLRNERAGHTLNTTGLVHEAYLRLVDYRKMSWQNRAHFFGAAARSMRNILIDHARSKSRQKRKGIRVGLTEAGALAGASLEQLLDLDDALERLGALGERLVRVVECRYFAGLTIEETAAALGVSHTTVSKDWKLARAWLQRELET